MCRRQLLLGGFMMQAFSICVAQALPPGFVEGDVVSHSYVTNHSWTCEEGMDICPYLVEYGHIASCLRLFNDVAYRQFAALNPVEDKSGEVELGISSDGRFFTTNGQPVFLQGMSYYGALGIENPQELEDDLKDMAADGFNWIRVWAYWRFPNEGGEDVSALTHDGQVREPYMHRLKALLTACNKRGMIVDVTIPFHAEGEAPGPRTHAGHLASVRALATALAPWRNAYFDIANERDVRDERYVSLEDIGRLMGAIKVIDSRRVGTASGYPGSREELADYLRIGKVDFIAPHLGRGEGSAAKTYGEVRQLIGWMEELGCRVPIHLQEPFRRGYAQYEPTVDDFIRDCSGAKLAEAAGWCLHNGADGNTDDRRPWRSFNMSKERLYPQLDGVERIAAKSITDAISGVGFEQRRYQAEYPEQLPHVIGERADGGWTVESGEGFMNYGPYIQTLPAGNHLARWRLKLDGKAASSDRAFTIDVAKNAGKTVLASRSIRPQDFESAGRWVEFELPFTSERGDALEFWTYWHGAGAGSMDWISVEIQHAP